MTARSHGRELRRDCQATTAVEFAVIASVLVPMLFGALTLGFLAWTHNALQSTAALTARCIALNSALCAGNLGQVRFAVNTAQQWIVPGVIVASDVVINTAATSCNGAVGSFVTVAIAIQNFWALEILPLPHVATTLQVNACFPVAAA